MVSVLYPLVMAELGFGYAQLGIVAASRTLLGSATQVAYGFLTPFARRTVLLGVGNVVLGIGTFLTGLAGSYAGFLGARALASAGSSAQHPVGSSLLAGYFPRSRGTVLSLNHSVAGVGSVLAPLAAGALLLVVGWRQVFLIVAFASMAMGLAYFVFRDRVAVPARATSTRGRLAAGRASYARVIRDRNLIVVALVMMAGAAGRSGGVNVTFLGAHLVNDLAIAVGIVGVLLSAFYVSGIAGTLAFGWLSDRLSRRAVMQATLLLSTATTWWVAHQGPSLVLLAASLVAYGAVIHTRNPLTQALVADSFSDADLDAAFSVYYFIGFVSGPLWTLLAGALMESFGFAFAFSLLSLSYLAGALLLFFLEDRPAALDGAAPRLA